MAQALLGPTVGKGVSQRVDSDAHRGLALLQTELESPAFLSASLQLDAVHCARFSSLASQRRRKTKGGQGEHYCDEWVGKQHLFGMVNRAETFPGCECGSPLSSQSWDWGVGAGLAVLFF